MKIRTQGNQLIDMTEKKRLQFSHQPDHIRYWHILKTKRKELSWENIAQSQRLFVFSVPYRLQLGIQRKSKSLKCHQMQR